MGHLTANRSVHVEYLSWGLYFFPRLVHHILGTLTGDVPPCKRDTAGSCGKHLGDRKKGVWSTPRVTLHWEDAAEYNGMGYAPLQAKEAGWPTEGPWTATFIKTQRLTESTAQCTQYTENPHFLTSRFQTYSAGKPRRGLKDDTAFKVPTREWLSCLFKARLCPELWRHQERYWSGMVAPALLQSDCAREGFV